MKFTEYIGSQFGNPHGLIGKICCVIMNRINAAMYNRVVEATGHKKCLLDIGFGNGFLEQKLVRKTQATIYGIDISSDMLESASKRNRKAVESGRIKFSLGDSCHLAFEDQKFDVVSSVNTIYFWEDTAKGLQEIYRVLKPEGVFYNVVYSREWLKKLAYTRTGFKLFDKTDYIRLGKQAGFKEVVIEEIVNGKSYFIQFIK